MALKEEFEQQGNWLFRYRGVLPIIILFIGAYLYLQTEIYPETFIFEGTLYEVYYEAACLVISLLGLGIRIYTVGYTPENTSGRNTANGQVADTLNTTGVYSVVRHPLYLGNLLMWLGVCLLTGNLWFIIAFCLLYWVYYERIMFAEEQFLSRKFGTVYSEWADKTPAFLPDFGLFIKPLLSFSWKKVLKKEKNGLLALFLIFCAFDLSGEWVEHQNSYNYFLIIACLISMVSYCVLKYLKKKTGVLNEAGR